MSTAPLPPIAPAHLDATVARSWPQQIHSPTEVPPDLLSNTDNTTLSYSIDRVQQSLRIVITDKNSGEVLRNIEFKSFPAHLHRTEKLSGLLLDRHA